MLHGKTLFFEAALTTAAVVLAAWRLRSASDKTLSCQDKCSICMGSLKEELLPTVAL